jgi:preprotein translocase subunit Sss1
MDPRRKKRRESKDRKKKTELSPVSSFQKGRHPLEPIIETPDVQYLSRRIQNRSREEVAAFWKIASVGAVIGGIGGLVIALLFILIAKLQSSSIISWNSIPDRSGISSWVTSSTTRITGTCPDKTCHLPDNNQIRGGAQKLGVEAYLDLYGRPSTSPDKVEENSIRSRSATRDSKRRLILSDLLSSSSSSKNAPKLVIAGKISVDDGSCNIGQLNLDTKEWSTVQRIQLSLYNSYAGGEVYFLLANHTSELPLSWSGQDHGR